MNKLTVLIIVAVVSGGGVLVARGAFIHSGTTSAINPQDALTDRRITMVEQRLFLLETRLNRLEQVASTTRAPSTDQSSVQIDLMRTEIDSMKSQIGLVDCALAKLDERTLPRTQRDQQTRDRTSDPCRHNPDTPLILRPQSQP